MSIELNQHLQAALETRVTPKQIAANTILAMSSVQLTETIATELGENPALEMLEQETCPICGAPITGSYCTECLPNGVEGGEREPRAAESGLVRDEADELDPVARAESEFTLAEHLLWNLRATLPARLHPVADYLVGALDDDGFLTQSDGEIAAAIGVTEQEVATVVAALRGIEPIGVGSRNVSESLLAQIGYLREIGEMASSELVERIVRDHLPDLGERRFARIASALGVSRSDVSEAWDLIRTNLHPYPAAAFGGDGNGRGPFLRPDVLIRAVDGELEVEVVESRRFTLRVEPTYAGLSARLRSAQASEADREHVREFVGRARFFIDNVNRRRATLQKIAECLVERQRDYLLHGVQHLVPLTRAEVGTVIGMHESTVSRATADKFVMVPTGEVVPFGHFFTAALGVKDQIRRIVEDEDPEHPHSDQEIGELLAEQGVAIARRTVAKYRDELRLLPARLRRR